VPTAAIPLPRDSGFTGTTDQPLYWGRYGTPGAPQLVVLHGGPGAHHDYLLPQFLDLALDHELLFYDQRGGGRSRTEDRTPVTWRMHVEDLGRVVAELVNGPVDLVGFSWGGMLALLYAVEAVRGGHLRAPSRLALVDPAPLSSFFRLQFEDEFARRQRAPEVQAMRDELAGSGLRERDAAAFRRRTFELSVAGYFADPRLATDLTPFRVTGRVQASVWESLGEFNLFPDLAIVRCPTLIVHGRQDAIPLASSEAAARALHAQLVVLDGCGHVPYVERRPELFSTLRSFLQPLAPA
jgi:proline iminopeptidase